MCHPPHLGIFHPGFGPAPVAKLVIKRGTALQHYLVFSEELTYYGQAYRIKATESCQVRSREDNLCHGGAFR
jgi:hypothetical protein